MTSAEQRLDEDMTLFKNARNEAIEECAKIAELHQRSHRDFSVAVDIAKAIRKLISD